MQRVHKLRDIIRASIDQREAFQNNPVSDLNSPTANLEIDARGLACPMPLLKAKQGLSRLDAGQRLRLLATDPGSERDFKTFVKLSEHTLIAFNKQDDVFEYLLEKGEYTSQ
ncbi:TusA-related sulfurtransferase [Alteromonadaceae bacterium 2753L.S.0a.02]|nr:TusA-related sulfurtransferase [Alteromonadaceae bacterium 2753L.S.0a.02]